MTALKTIMVLTTLYGVNQPMHQMIIEFDSPDACFEAANTFSTWTQWDGEEAQRELQTGRPVALEQSTAQDRGVPSTSATAAPGRPSIRFFPVCVNRGQRQ